LITDRPFEVNLREISEVKKRYPKQAVIASLMVEIEARSMAPDCAAIEDAGADGPELNFAVRMG